MGRKKGLTETQRLIRETNISAMMTVARWLSSRDGIIIAENLQKQEVKITQMTVYNVLRGKSFREDVYNEALKLAKQRQQEASEIADKRQKELQPLLEGAPPNVPPYSDYLKSE